MEIFRGIRFARANRFERPVLEPGLTNIDHLETELKICPQNPSHFDQHIGLVVEETPKEQSEDCLRLTICTPSTKKPHPVLVWIHGGAFITGSGLNDRFEPSQLAEMGDIVVVNISYRLGALGFLYKPKQGIKNLGMEDQVCALHWIKQNISLFGGDPQNITLFGQSAGGFSILHHIANLNEPLFNKCIIASVPFLSSSRRHAKKTTKRFLKFLNADPKSCSLEDILKAQEKTIENSKPGMPFSPVSEDYDNPEIICPELKAALIWCQKDDALPFIPFKSISRPATKLLFKHPTNKYSKHLRKFGLNVTNEVLNWRHGESEYGAEHCMEIPLLFGNWDYWKNAPFMADVSHAEYEEQAYKLKQKVIDFIRKN